MIKDIEYRWHETLKEKRNWDIIGEQGKWILWCNDDLLGWYIVPMRKRKIHHDGEK